MSHRVLGAGGVLFNPQGQVLLIRDRLGATGVSPRGTWIQGKVWSRPPCAKLKRKPALEAL